MHTYVQKVLVLLCDWLKLASIRPLVGQRELPNVMHASVQPAVFSDRSCHLSVFSVCSYFVRVVPWTPFIA